jgi:hypothetical protein
MGQVTLFAGDEPLDEEEGLLEALFPAGVKGLSRFDARAFVCAR